MATKRLRLVSWNTCGLKTRSKHQKVPQELTRLKASVAFLQETHIGPQDETLLQDIPGWKSYFTVYKSKSKGVAILIKKDLPFQYICHDEDCDGGYIVLFCQINGHTYTLVNVYKHKSDTEMLNRLAQYLQETVSGTLVIGGDFNGVLDPHWDRKNPGKGAKPAKHVRQFTSILHVVDVCSTKKPTVTEFTYQQNECASRIDMFFMMPKDMNSVYDIMVLESKISDHDHDLLALELKQGDMPKPLQGKLKQVSIMLEKYKSDYRDRKISGAEILMAINSLRVWCQGTEIEQNIEMYKKNVFLKTEKLKIEYNYLKNKSDEIQDDFKCRCSTSASSLHHLVFTKVLELYTQAQLPSSLSNCEVGETVSLYYIFQIKPNPQKIRIGFLDTIVKIGCHRDLSIISKLLADDPESEFHKLLMENCPLTKTVLTLALKHLAKQLQAKKYKVTFSQHRLTLHVYGNPKYDSVKELYKKYKESGLELLDIAKI